MTLSVSSFLARPPAGWRGKDFYCPRPAVRTEWKEGGDRGEKKRANEVVGTLGFLISKEIMLMPEQHQAAGGGEKKKKEGLIMPNASIG